MGRKNDFYFSAKGVVSQIILGTSEMEEAMGPIKLGS